ncbi:MAG: PQQ-binding-like beta-propeller repeat protein [Pirellulales bacterium]|nr:PQQ-binding-like beta-propeller repeat protein [Pirellulales bacterium]
MQDMFKIPLHLLLSAMPFCFIAADWYQFRGPAGNGVLDARDLPESWSPSENLVWRVQLPGPGASSPIVLGERVYLTCYSGYGVDEDESNDMALLQRHVICIDLKNGKIIWDRPMQSSGSNHSYEGFQSLHGYASSTLATDGKSIYYFFGTSGAGALLLDGESLWSTDVGSNTHSWGSGTSPVLHGDLVIINASVESGMLFGLNKVTGEVVWRAGGMEESWSTPVLVTVPGGGTEVVASVKNRLLAFDPVSGEALWTCDSMQDYICPSPVAHHGVVYAIGAREGTALAVRAGGRGDVTKTHRQWLINKGSNVSSPVYYDGYLYWVHEGQGSAYCVDAATGDVVFGKRLSPRPGKIYASPVIADGKIFIVSREKGTFVLAARPEYELIAHNEPLDESIHNGSPAIAGNRLLIRSDQWLYCIGK